MKLQNQLTRLGILGYNINEVKLLSANRIKESEAFNEIKNTAQWIGKQNDKVYSLKLDKYSAEQKEIKEAVKKSNAIVKAVKEIPIAPLDADNAKYNSVDKDKGERFKAWLKNLRSDIYISETVNVVDDMIKLHGLVAQK